MPREIFSLTDATQDTLKPNIGAIELGWRKSDKYIYAILKEEKTDPFAPFESLYAGALKGGVSTCHWDNHLEFLRFRYAAAKRIPDTADCFKEKLRMHGATLGKFIEAFSDGEFSAEEIKQLEHCLDAEEQNIQMIRTMLNFRKSLIK